MGGVRRLNASPIKDIVDPVKDIEEILAQFLDHHDYNIILT